MYAVISSFIPGVCRYEELPRNLEVNWMYLQCKNQIWDANHKDFRSCFVIHRLLDLKEHFLGDKISAFLLTLASAVDWRRAQDNKLGVFFDPL